MTLDMFSKSWSG